METKTLKEYDNEYASLLSNDVPITEIESKNIFDISGFPHYETVWSNLYAYFLKDDEEHGLKDLFLSALLRLINKQTSIFQSLKSLILLV
ncbi:MAG: PD-(D/E)XK nuclease family protein [Chitinophagales bacterium]|nr:PD-(D/E)XK nuclease family protein [Chitinophagales bacterium]